MTQEIKVPYNYLQQQFPVGIAYEGTSIPTRFPSGLTQDIMKDIYELVEVGDYTLGSPVKRFEDAVCNMFGCARCIGVNSGTDALFLSLKALGVGHGDTVLTTPNTFVATVGAIQATGAYTKFIDVTDSYTMNLEKASQRKMKCAIPVHLTGLAIESNMWRNVVYDSAQAIGASWHGKSSANFDGLNAFSMHPLKNVNGWGDSGFITTNNNVLADDLVELRNHGLYDRDTVVRPGYNSRLDSIQAIVAYHVLKTVDYGNDRRNKFAKMYDEGFKDVTCIHTPNRPERAYQAFHTYIVQVSSNVSRRELMNFLRDKGIESKVHYPIPVHLQPGYSFLGYREGDFPVVEEQAKRILTLPIHPYLTEMQVNYVIEAIAEFDKSHD